MLIVVQGLIEQKIRHHIKKILLDCLHEQVFKITFWSRKSIIWYEREYKNGVT